MALRAKLVFTCLTSFVFLASIYQNPGLARSKWSTPAQVEGPYYPQTKPKEVDSNLLDFLGRGLPDGEPLQLKGRVFDQKGILIEGARVEIWQNDNNGIYNHHKAPTVSYTHLTLPTNREV